MRGIEREPGVVYSALVPNLRGAERAIDAGVDEMNLVMSASESHNLANLRMTREQSFAALARGGGAGAARMACAINVSLSCAFGCPMEGEVARGGGAGLVRALRRRLGARGITLCDTTGMAYPTPGARADAARCASAGPDSS